jgi:hypothetical protein
MSDTIAENIITALLSKEEEEEKDEVNKYFPCHQRKKTSVS